MPSTVTNPPSKPEIGVVAIGRNEGERLRRCLASVLARTDSGSAAEALLPVVVYVDSNSTDGSVAVAEGFGAEVVNLDTRQKFTAARARNSGLERLLLIAPHVEYVQFLDGDCELDPGWLEVASAFLQENPAFAVVCGRRRERFPERSVFNRLCDIEWDSPIGERPACGGDALMRVSVVREVGGYRESLIAGEEPEMCFRMRKLGHRVMRLDAEMTLHDAAMFRVAQWFQRNKRAGHAAAEMAALHGSDAERPGRRQTVSFVVWGAVFPVTCFGLGALFPSAGVLLLVLGWGQLYLRSLRAEAQRRKRDDAALYAAACVLAKVPGSVGVFTYYKNRLLGRQSTLVEYKSETSGA